MLTLLKLGGSLITDKHSPQTAKPEVIARLADEIFRFWQANPDLQLILGHGSGSFGHVSARKYGTRMGVKDREGWLGFAAVWKDARALNDIVLEELTAVGLPIIAMPPSATVIASNGVVSNWNLEPIQAALLAGLIPLINGDTIFDRKLGGTILSTEDLFIHLAAHLPTDRILLAGIEAGVWADYPVCQHLVPHITPENYSSTVAALTGSAAIDVTGGMAEKVTQMLTLVKKHPHINALIFSGLEPGNIEQALADQFPGTRISANDMNREP
jgi:isopentenyl phosphate kinase